VPQDKSIENRKESEISVGLFQNYPIVIIGKFVTEQDHSRAYSGPIPQLSEFRLEKFTNGRPFEVLIQCRDLLRKDSDLP
jgi:hypothetical protein